MCEHKIVVKSVGNNIVSYCEKCGKIIDTTPKPEKPMIEIAGFKDNGGQILHG